MKVTLSLFFAGLLFGSGPCLASCGPILISYIAGTGKNISRGLITYILFSLSRIFVYLLLSLSVFILGNLALERFITGSMKYVFIAGGIFIIMLGLLMAGGASYKIYPYCSLRNILLERDKKSIISLGLIIGLLPCAPLLAILSYIGLVSKSWWNSLIYSFSFGLGTFISPLIFLVMLSGLIYKFFQNKRQVYIRIFNLACGIIIIFYGIQLIRKGILNA